MRSALEAFGAISLATKDTQVFSADRLDWATIDSRFRTANHLTGVHPDGVVVFNAAADFVSTDGFIPSIQDSADDSTYADLIVGPQIDTWLGSAPKKGVCWILPLPKFHRRYMRAAATPKSSGTFTAKTVNAYIEYGSNIPTING